MATKLALVSAGIALATPTIGQNFTLVTGSANPFVDSTIDPNVPFGLLDVGTDSAPTFVDIDGDGDLDAFIGIDFGTINYFQNVGDSLNPSFTLNAAANPFSSVDVGSNASITLVDIDADEDFDAFIGESSGNIRYYENVGNINTPNFVLISSSFAFGISDIGSFAVPTFGDIDNDGDLDLFVGESNGNVNYFENMVVSQMRTMISIPELLLL
ncbi:MAG: VCBS repeat-containing protein [Bacteroidota bacterium]